MYVCMYVFIYLYGIHHCNTLRNSYSKLARVGFGPTTTQFRSGALTDWATDHEFSST